MKEIEVKILDIDKDKIIKKIEEAGAKKIFEGDTISHFFYMPEEETLRLRQEGNKTFLTYKKKEPHKTLKIMEELEVDISDIEEMKKILEKLGFKMRQSFTKHRISYKLNKARYEIDTWPEIPTYLEVEAPTEKDIKDALEIIGLDIKNSVPWSANEVYKKYGKDIWKNQN
ncbi:class IV adenylate cyclase [Candidatus Woesearchaeota archaeon]|nr:class IV adenylate cyclase [Candidatus Woesearchaeota archaeon]